MSDYAATAASIASEALSHITVVQAFGANVRLEEKFSQALKASESEGLKKATAIGIQSGILYFVAYAANGLAFYRYGGTRTYLVYASFSSSSVRSGSTKSPG